MEFPPTRVKPLQELGGKWLLNTRKTNMQGTFLNSGKEGVYL